MGIKWPNSLANLPRFITNIFELKHSRKVEEHRRHQAHRPPSKDRKPRRARRHVVSRRVSHIVRAHVSELAFLVQKSAVRTDVADV